MLTVTELKALLIQNNIRPRKHLGQNFLIDKNIAGNMIDRCQLHAEEWVIEIGAGFGAMTEQIACLVKKIIAVEKDKRVYSILRDLTLGFGNIDLICADFLELDLAPILRQASNGVNPVRNGLSRTDISNGVKVIGNLPYYITSPIIEKLITNKEGINSIFITVQKEVAERLCASPGGKDYGSLSCFVQFYTKPEVLLNIGRRAFYPQPAVDSVFMRLTVLNEPAFRVNNTVKFFEIIRAAFGKRRKTFLNGLLYCPSLNINRIQALSLLEKAGINPDVRPERLSLEDFARVSNLIEMAR